MRLCLCFLQYSSILFIGCNQQNFLAFKRQRINAFKLLQRTTFLAVESDSRKPSKKQQQTSSLPSTGNKFPMVNNYSKLDPTGEIHLCKRRKNPGSGDHIPYFEGLLLLETERREDMSDTERFACFSLINLPKLAVPFTTMSKMKAMGLVCHHGVPVNRWCNGSDQRSNHFWITHGQHFFWHFCLWVLFNEPVHAIIIRRMLNGVSGKGKTGVMTPEGSQKVLCSEIANILPLLEALDVVVPDNILDFAREVNTANILSREVQLACDASNKVRSQFMEGNQYGIGNQNALGYKHTDATKAKIGAAKKGNQNFLGHKHSDATKAKISAASKGRKHSDAAKAQMSASSKGRKNVGRIGEANGNTKYIMTEEYELTLIEAVHEYKGRNARVKWVTIYEEKFTHLVWDTSNTKQRTEDGNIRSNNTKMGRLLYKYYEKLTKRTNPPQRIIDLATELGNRK